MEESENGTNEGMGTRSSVAAEPASIVTYKDGPYVVRGSFAIFAQDGTAIDPGRRTVALCRCGKSRTRPFCDGTHRIAGFEAPGVPAPAATPVRPPAAAPAPRQAPRLRSASRAPAQFGIDGGEDRLSLVLTCVHIAHAALICGLEEACEAEDELAMRLAEPLVRAAWALLETRALQPPAPFPRGLPAGGRELAVALIDMALGATVELCQGAEDTLLETAGGLLADARAELDLAGDCP